MGEVRDVADGAAVDAPDGGGPAGGPAPVGADAPGPGGAGTAPEPEATDPLEYLTRHAAHSVQSTRMLTGVARAASEGQLTVSDAQALSQVVQTRAEAGGLLFAALQRDARLPEGVRVILAELAVCHAALAAVLGAYGNR